MIQDPRFNLKGLHPAWRKLPRSFYILDIARLDCDGDYFAKYADKYPWIRRSLTLEEIIKAFILQEPEDAKRWLLQVLPPTEAAEAEQILNKIIAHRRGERK